MFTIADGREKLKQWDIDVKLRLDETATSICGARITSRFWREALFVPITRTETEAYVLIPNIFLQKNYDVFVYAYCEETKCTKAVDVFEIEAAPKPSDYVYTESEILTFATLDKRITDLEETGGVSDEQIDKAFSNYLEKNPIVTPDLTAQVERAETAARAAETANNTATSNASTAVNAANSANTSATQAASAASAADGSAARAGQSETNAENAADRAEDAAKRAEEAATNGGNNSGGFAAQDTPPEDTSVLWINTSYEGEEQPGSSADIQEAVNLALAQAKESGLFDGEKGDPGDDYVLTSADKTDIVNSVLSMLPTWTGGSF